MRRGVLAIEVAAGRLSAADDDAGAARRAIFTRPIFPIRMSSSAPAASSGCRISCCGRRPTASSFSCRSIGPISTAPRWKARSPSSAAASAASADWSHRPDRDHARTDATRADAVTKARRAAKRGNLVLRVGVGRRARAARASLVPMLGGWLFLALCAVAAGVHSLGMDVARRRSGPSLRISCPGWRHCSWPRR